MAQSLEHLWQLDFRERDLVRRGTLQSVFDVDDTIARCQRGDEEAFRTLFLRHRAEVARIVFRMAGGTELDDLVQEVFLQVHRSLKDFRGQAKFSTWLHRVAVNVVLMQRRAARSRPRWSDGEPSEAHPDGRIPPDEDAARLERMRAFRKLLDRLPEKKRTVFVLHEIEGLAPAEIGRIVGAPVLTVRTRLFYARRELAQMMREEPSLAALTQTSSEISGEESTETFHETSGLRRRGETSVEEVGACAEKSLERVR